MRDFFRRKPAKTQAPRSSPEDRLIAALEGYTTEAWNNLPALTKVDIRKNFYHTKGL